MTPDISAIAKKWAQVAWKFPMLKSRVVTAIESACAEATASLRAQLEELTAEIGKSNELGQEWMAKAKAAEQRWIPVKEQLPKAATHVLVFVPKYGCNDCQAVTFFRTDSYGDYAFQIRADCGSDGTVTHWMPLPAAPVAQESPLNGKHDENCECATCVSLDAAGVE